jgi:hypothetical protein
MWQHGNFYICAENLSRFFGSFHKHATNRIKSLDIDVTTEESEGGNWDAMQIADYLRPLCQEARLQRVVIHTVVGYEGNSPWDWHKSYMQCDQIARYLRNTYLAPKNVGRVILVEHRWHRDERF